MTQYGDPGDLLSRAYRLSSPALIIENKLLYSRELANVPPCDAPDVAVITYGGCVEHAVEAAEDLRSDEEITVRTVVLTQLSPFPAEQVLRETRDVSRVLVVEEGTPGWGLASECARHLIGRPIMFRSLAAAPHPIPSSLRWEQEILPNKKMIISSIIEMLSLK